ncbi:protein-vacuolar targeting protein Atg18 [Lineolata rhizophorae]|uniref:Protein-vacuolar targeting protein Atg18 n=1 Tax=Lineolata rhizophorae TaxID=578093 RepID=A0A6A6P4S4_9PEZI|nr:protein-vacuolar targeting protein Atg18 [Lineolata rhizophorae]
MNFVTFNQDYSHLGVGTTRGYRIYSTDPFSKTFQSHEGDITMLEMLFSTSLVALVKSPRLLRIENTKRRTTICELTFPTTVLAVKMNRKRLVMVLEVLIFVYDISNMTLLQTISTSPNPLGICALSPSSDNNYLAYPHPQRNAASNAAASSFAPPSHAPPGAAGARAAAAAAAPSSGEVMLHDLSKLEAVNVVEAHQTPLSCVALNSDGTLLATASEKGTIVRVFSVPDAQKLFQFRRGSIPARIYSMSFNATGSLLCVSSATETVHIFRLAANGHPATPTTPSAAGAASSSNLYPSGASNADASTTSLASAGGGPASPTLPPEGERLRQNPTFASMLRRTSQSVGKSFAATVGGYLPAAVSEMWEPARDFAWVKVPRGAAAAAAAAARPPGSPRGNGSGGGSLKTVVALSGSGPQVMVVTSEGNFFVFNVDLERGGEGTLVSQYS